MAHMNLGIAYSEPKDENKKLEHFLKAVKINPQNHRIFYNVGDIFLKNGEIGKAIGHCKKALGIAFSKKGSLDKVAKHFQLASILDPQMVEAKQNLEITLGKMDNSN